jgi:hypothetical protein
MMALVYFAGVFFVSIMARVFSWLAHRALLAVNNTEHEIQTLKSGQKQSISLLTEAGRGEWTNSLSSRLHDSFAVISEMAGKATNQTVELRDILESSRYRDIFNFVKYGNWIQGQVLSPIEEILTLLQKNHDTIYKTLLSLDSQISDNTDPSLQKPLIFQKERLEMQMESITPMIEMLEGYKERLNPNK